MDRHATCSSRADPEHEGHLMTITAADALCLALAALLGAACAKNNNAADTTAAATGAGTPPPTAARSSSMIDTALRASRAGGELATGIDVSSWTDNNIAAALEGANQSEIGLARIAERRATARDVKEFAKMLIDDHSRLLSSVKQLAQSQRLPAKTAPNDTVLKAMKDAEQQFTSMPKGASWDSAYVNHEILDHQETIANAKAMQQHASNAQLKQAIDQAMPILQRHLDRAQQLQTALASGSQTNMMPSQPDTTPSGKGAKKGGA
jgi:putative membrane protein